MPANKYFNKKYSNTLKQFESYFLYQHIFKNRLEICILYLFLSYYCIKLTKKGDFLLLFRDFGDFMVILVISVDFG